METGNILDRIEKALTPLETENVINFFKELSLKTLMDNPWMLFILAFVLLFAIFKRSKFILLFLFSFIMFIALIHYTLPSGKDLTVTSFLPFAFGSLCIGLVILYFAFIKTE
jgi:hypothetical protein